MNDHHRIFVGLHVACLLGQLDTYRPGKRTFSWGYQHKCKDGKMDRKCQQARGGPWKRARNKRRRQAIKRQRSRQNA